MEKETVVTSDEKEYFRGLSLFSVLLGNMNQKWRPKSKRYICESPQSMISKNLRKCKRFRNQNLPEGCDVVFFPKYLMTAGQTSVMK